MNNYFDHVIATLLHDNRQRQQAETYINNMVTANFEEFIDAALQSMKNSNVEIAKMAAVILKKKCLDIKRNLESISLVKMMHIIDSIKACISPGSTDFLKLCCDILVKLYIHMNMRQELLPFMKTMTNYENVNMKITLMYLIKLICEFAYYNDIILMENWAILKQIFQQGLKNKYNQTLTVFLSSFHDERFVKQFDSELLIILTNSTQVIKYDKELRHQTLESINDLINIHPKFMKPIMPHLIRIFGDIMSNRIFYSQLRITAMAGMQLICIHSQAHIRKNEFFKTKMAGIYMKILSENEKMPVEKWASELNSEFMPKDDVSIATEVHLSQILPCLGVRFMLPLFIGAITAALRSSQSNEQHAGLTAMAILTEGSYEIFGNELPNFLVMITPLTETENPRVLSDIIVLLGYLCEEFSPAIQNRYDGIVLNLIIKCLRHPLPKLQINALKCIQNYCPKSFQHQQQAYTLIQFMDQIVFDITKIFNQAIQSSNFDMTQAIIETFSSFASVVSFEKYYSSFMPNLKKIILNFRREPHFFIIRNLTIECIGFMLISIKDNKSMFDSELQLIMESLLCMQKILDVDDILHSAMFKVYEQVASCLKENFNYADRIIDRLIQCFIAKVDYKMIEEIPRVDRYNYNQQNKFIKLSVDMELIGGIHNIFVNTNTLEIKVEAANLLVSLAKNMGTNFSPFVVKSIQAVTSHLNFKDCDHIRYSMKVMVKLLVDCCQTAEQKLFVLQQTMPSLLSELINVIQLQQDEDIELVLEVIASVMPYFTEQMLTMLPQLLNSSLVATINIIQEIKTEYSQQQMDDDLQKKVEQEIHGVEVIYQRIEEIIRASGNRREYIHLKEGFPSEYEFTMI